MAKRSNGTRKKSPAKVSQAPTEVSPAPTGPRGVGRPAIITRERIATAAFELGLDHVTMKAVAAHLGVSVAGLYHHVDGKDDLLRLAAEYSARQVVPPADRDQHWAVWLLQWARYNRDVFVTQPALLSQYLEGALSADAIAQNADAILGLLMRQGFAVEEAQTAYEIVSTCAIGFAVALIREQRSAATGHPTLAEQHRVLALRPANDLPNLRQLIAERITKPAASFEARIATVLVGIAVERGDTPASVKKALADARRRAKAAH